MTGPQHYREAERLVDKADHYTYGDGADPVIGAAFAAEAQVHATLALVAVQVDMALPSDFVSTDCSVGTEWHEATS